MLASAAQNTLCNIERDLLEILPQPLHVENTNNIRIRTQEATSPMRSKLFWIAASMQSMHVHSTSRSARRPHHMYVQSWLHRWLTTLLPPLRLRNWAYPTRDVSQIHPKTNPGRKSEKLPLKSQGHPVLLSTSEIAAERQEDRKDRPAQVVPRHVADLPTGYELGLANFEGSILGST